MNRFAWLLVLPYAVTFSTTSFNDQCTLVLVKKTMLYEVQGNKCDKVIRESMLDQAAALNEAHERRTSKTKHFDIKEPITTKFDYEKACDGSCSEDK